MFFKGGLHQASFETKNCCDCLNFKSVNNNIPAIEATDYCFGFGCVLMDVHILYQNDKNTNEFSQKILNKLLPANEKCPMRLTINDCKKQCEKQLLKQNQELKQEILNLKNGFNQLRIIEREK